MVYSELPYIALQHDENGDTSLHSGLAKSVCAYYAQNR